VINFGVLYGMSAFRLSNRLGISGSEAKTGSTRTSRAVEDQEYLDRTLVDARNTGKVTRSSAACYIPEILTVRSRCAAAQAHGHECAHQGNGSGHLKMAMIALERRLNAHASGARMHSPCTTKSSSRLRRRARPRWPRL
jgi:DNA polymerase-1